ncbi:hypothetical protein IJ556_03535, partial [bacterium]|nr:hypothetical protein [bacterium]
MKNMKYYIQYGTGAGDFYSDSDDLNRAMTEADNNAAYTQCDIKIMHGDKLVAIRSWNGCAFDSEVSDETDIIDFGSFGYYGEWVVLAA